MRLGIERYQQKLKVKISDSIESFLDQFLYENFSRYTSHPWRLDRYWNEECDTVIKENGDTLREIFN